MAHRKVNNRVSTDAAVVILHLSMPWIYTKEVAVYNDIVSPEE